ncbi:hypothetical protein KIH74_33965 [Kineosporia sp. J2-2]|uniref:Uncharacterized protein n=1 Tax=Kineosporia corallincola TaxID=2835133 RepID=A0ABS5TT53_9ACTN|nr:hypothetical protein [Kineosporia corallincola]MBT0774001.1 hypothetical protein [Kineosporia corallincola]
MSATVRASRSTTVWMLEDDAGAFARHVRRLLPSAWWMCSRVGPGALHQVHQHPTLPDALECGGREQCFLPLPAGAQGPEGALAGAGVVTEPGLRVAALVRFLGTRHRPAGLFAPEVLGAGQVSVRWDDATGHDVLTRQVGAVWEALEATTTPAVLSKGTGAHAGGRAEGSAKGDGLGGSGPALPESEFLARIGPAARELVVRQGLSLAAVGRDEPLWRLEQVEPVGTPRRP